MAAEVLALARGMAQAMMDGFNRHYQLFRQESARGKHRFETCDWHGQQRAQRERIEFYDLRVRECQKRLEREFAAGSQPMAVWHQTKLDYIALLVPHAQPELAETFFNSVSTKILHRSYFNNDFLFVRPAISTEYMESDMPGAKPTFSAFYPAPDGLAATLARIIESFELRCHFEDLPRDARRVAGVLERELGAARRHTNLQLQVLGSLFYRNKGAYVVGKLVNGYTELPFALPILHRTPGTVFVDAVLHGEQDLSMLFSFSRAYFMVDMEIPSAYVRFLAELMPRKPRAEIYNALGLGKQGKNLFYRELLWHLRHSSVRFRIAPGIRGMVMLVFDLPSYPYVFKIIKDEFAPPKEITREQVRRKYQLVKRHDRVGRMADTMEFSQLAFPRARLDEALIEEIERLAPSQIEHTEDEHGRAQIVIRHAYIERRMIPLNIWLHEALQADPDDPDAQARLEHAVLEYGKAIKDLVAANIFPGDMLWKNFGVTRHAKVVFYDYDEIEYLTDCHFRHVPAPRTEEDEMSGEIWYSVAKNDVFPETFGPFLLGHPRVREQFMRHHAELLTPEFWQEHQQRIRAGEVMDVFPYDRGRRFDPLEPAGNPD